VQCVLHRDRVLLGLDEQIGQVLGGPDVWRRVTIRFAVDDSTFESLRSALARVFAGCACFVDLSS